MRIKCQVKLHNERIDQLPNEELKQAVRDSVNTLATIGSAGIDLRYVGNEQLEIPPNQCVKVGSGIAIYIGDPDYVGMIFPRSGSGSSGIVLGNLTGIIDSDYQGELMLTIWNRTDNTRTIDPGERVCQYMIVEKITIDADIVEEFSVQTERGSGGFGSSGKL